MTRFETGSVVEHPDRGVGTVIPNPHSTPLAGRVLVAFDTHERPLFCWENDVSYIFADVDGVEATALTDGGER